MKRIHLIILGKVQGVFYRASTEHQAKQLGLVGWVKNCPDGSVEVIAEGKQNALEKLITWCYKGPQLARVDDIKIQYLAATGEFNDFQVK